MDTTNYELKVAIELADHKHDSKEVKQEDAKYGQELEMPLIKFNEYTKNKKKGNPCLRLLELVFKAVTKGSSLLDAITDIILLIAAASNGVILFTMILFITLLAPYILSYSSGVELFLYRKTFQNVEPFTFKSLLLLFYLLPTGILYFIVIDLVDMLQQFSNFILFVCGKTKADIARIEAHTAEYFGMSRMDWLSFGQQKKIAQLFFETVPQVILQTLIYTDTISGRELTGITNRALLISVGSASFNLIVTLVKLYAESRGVQETFVEYSLHAITARYGWVPFRKRLVNYLNGNYKNVHRKQNCCNKWWGFNNLDQNNTTIDYKIKYRIPIVTYLSNESLRSSIIYDFSRNTIASFIAIIKSNYDNTNNNKLNNNDRLTIKFGDSLRLLTVRQIIKVMQACCEKEILLPDIHEIDWSLAFANSTKYDPRLYSYTFDEHKKPLLTSLYLTGYNNKLWSILKLFIYDFDADVNAQDDEGNTILHHMLNKKDFLAIKVLFNSLQPNQRVNFNIQNDEGIIIIHEIIKQQGSNGLRDVLNVLKPRQKVHFNVKNNDGNTIFHYLIHNNKIKEFESILAMIINNNNFIDFSILDENGKSMMYLALEMDKTKLCKQKLNNKVKNQEIHIQNNSIFVEKMKQIVNKTETDLAENKQEESLSETSISKNEYINQDKFYDESVNNWTLFLKQWNEVVDKKLINKSTLVNILFVKLTQLMSKSGIKNDFEQNQNAIKEMNYRIANIYMTCNDNTIKNKIEQNMMEVNGYENEDNENDKKQESADDYKENMFHIVLLKFGVNLSETINSKSMSALGYVLKHYFEYEEYFEIIDYLLNNNAKLLLNQVSQLVAVFVYASSKVESNKYFNYFEKALKTSNIPTTAIVNSERNTPIHNLIKSYSVKISARSRYINKLYKLCSRYPEWLLMKNVKNETTLLLAIRKKDFDGFFCVFRHLLKHNTCDNLSKIISSKMYVESMIDFGIELLEKRRVNQLAFILKCFNYFEIFYYPSHKTHISNIINDNEQKDEFISLIQEIGLNEEARKNVAWYDTNDDIYTRDILFNIVGLTKTYHKLEFCQDKDYFEQQVNKEIGHYFKVDDDYYEDLIVEKREINQIDYDDENDEDLIINMIDNSFQDVNSHRINYIEIIYSTIVESFSTLDLITDVIIFMQLYNTNNQWWSTCMVVLLISPYLVSYGSLATLLQQKIFYTEANNCISLLILLLMTPLSVFYLFAIDLIFMIYSLVSTLLFVITFTKFDIKPILDQYIFHKILRMNRTEVIGYRRLRTLSQLLFETIPQILLQGRILYVIEINGDNDNQFQIDIETIIVSISLAAVHLIMEGGVIWLDSKTLKMTFMQYSLISLGGRVQWIPYQHFFANIVKNQLFMENIFDSNESNIQNRQSTFNCLDYTVNCIENDDDKNDEDKVKLFALDYEAIYKDILFFRYEITYQFSNALVKYFSSELLNAPLMIIPKEFKLSSTNIALQHFFKSIFCKTQLNFGYESVGNINIFSLCELYLSSLNRLQLNIARLDNRTVKKLVSNTTTDKDSIKNIIISSLINYGEVTAIEWPIFNTYQLSYNDKVNIQLNILLNCIPSNKNNFVLDLCKLRNCFKNKCYLGSDCMLMEKIKQIVNEYSNRCKYDGSWCFVVMLLLLYTRGSIFWGECVNGCCKINQQLLNKLFHKYLPKHIKLDEMLIPFELFECSKLFNDNQIEQIVVNTCKNWIILHDENIGDNNNKQAINAFIEMPTEKYDMDLFKYIGNEKFNYLINKLSPNNNSTIEHEDIAELDELVYEFKLYTGYNLYLQKTLLYRELSKFDSTKITLKANTINSFSINKFIPKFDNKNQNRLQIFEITIWSDDQKINVNDEIKQIYFVTNSNSKKENNSILNDRILLYNPINNDASMSVNMNVNELSIKHTNVGLSFYNYYLLHETDNTPKIIIETNTTVEIAMHIKYSKLYTIEDEVKKPKYPTLTCFALSTSLFAAVNSNNYVNKSNDVTKHELMNLCMEISLFVSVPNKAKFQIDYKRYCSVLERYFIPIIANIITSYIVHPETYLRWEHMVNMPTNENNYGHSKSSYINLENQLEYTYFDSIVDFRNATVDAIVVPTTILDRNYIYYINCYFFGKGDESWIGITSTDAYHNEYKPTTLLRGKKNTIIYYGGRKRSTKRAGGSKNDTCVSSWNPGIDCNHSSIYGGHKGEVLLHPLDAHGEGDWINFKIDFKNNIFSVYKNGIFQGKVENQIPDGDIYFISEPDTAVDKYYVEEAIDDSNYIYPKENVDDNKDDVP